MNVSLFEAGHISPTRINQSNAATTTNIPTTTTIPVGLIVNPTFTPPPSGRQFLGRLLWSPCQSCRRCQATTAPQAQLIDCCFKPLFSPLPDNQNASPSSWALSWRCTVASTSNVGVFLFVFLFLYQPNATYNHSPTPHQG